MIPIIFFLEVSFYCHSEIRTEHKVNQHHSYQSEDPVSFISKVSEYWLEIYQKINSRHTNPKHKKCKGLTIKSTMAVMIS